MGRGKKIGDLSSGGGLEGSEVRESMMQLVETLATLRALIEEPQGRSGRETTSTRPHYLTDLGVTDSDFLR